MGPPSRALASRQPEEAWGLFKAARKSRLRSSHTIGRLPGFKVGLCEGFGFRVWGLGFGISEGFVGFRGGGVGFRCQGRRRFRVYGV